MAIRIENPPHPLSEQSLSTGPEGETILIDSSAARLLRQELERYCEDSITGRSFLIAGHRGAGKTTMVDNALLTVWKRHASREMLRPLRVALHGPSLFPEWVPVPTSAPEAAAVSGSPSPLRAADKKNPSVAEVALKQITLGLHRSVAEEFARCYWLATRRSPRTRAWESRRAQMPRVPQDVIDAFELAAQFETELHESPTPSRLREFWVDAGVLDEGILGARGSRPVPPGQGMRELVALSSIVEAYRRVAGELTRSEEAADVEKLKQHAEVGADMSGKDIFKPLASLAAGSLAGAGVYAGNAGAFEAAIAGTVAALGASWVFKISSSRSSDRQQSRSQKFIPDLTVSTLDRVLPILISRLRAAGIAPVFVIDELDKVQGLASRILSMVHFLKKLVAEHAFFCFLADRGYFEELAVSGATKAYDVSYSYYSHRLLIAFRPDDIDDYLRRRLKPGDAPDDKIDCTLLRWALRHRSRLHPLDLQREIAAIRGDDDNVALPAGRARSASRYRIDVTMQVAIELAMAQRDLSDWLTEHPDLRQVLYDAVYYVTREWLKERRKLDLSSEGFPEFVRYLDDRMNRQGVTLPAEPAADVGRSRGLRAASVGAPKEAAPAQRLHETEARFLFYGVQWICAFLADDSAEKYKLSARQTKLLDDWDTARKDGGGSALEQEVRDALLSGAGVSLLSDRGGGSYEFRYFPSGTLRSDAAQAAAAMPVGPGAQPAAPAAPAPAAEPTGTTVTPPGAEPPAAPQAETGTRASDVDARSIAVAVAQSRAAFIDHFSSMLARVTASESMPEPISFSTLAERFRVIGTTPAWSEVKLAMARIAVVSDTGYAMLAEDMHVIEQFAALVMRNQDLIYDALICAAIIGRGSEATDLAGRILIGLDVLSRALHFEAHGESGVVNALAAVKTAIAAAPISLHRFTESAPSCADEQYGDWLTAQLALTAEYPDAGYWRAHSDIAWNAYRARVAGFLSGRGAAEPVLDELFCAGAKVGPWHYIRSIDPAETTLVEWNNLLFGAMPSLASTLPEVPAWFGAAALDALSAPRDPEMIERLQRFIPDLSVWANTEGLISAERVHGTLVVLRYAETSVMAQWLPHDAQNIFVLTPDKDQVEWLRENPAFLEALPPPHALAVELGPNQRVPRLDRTLKSLQGATPENPVYVYRGTPAVTPPGPRVVVNPTSAEQIFAAGMSGRGPM